jgi:putative heme iron utilization protein
MSEFLQFPRRSGQIKHQCFTVLMSAEFDHSFGFHRCTVAQAFAVHADDSGDNVHIHTVRPDASGFGTDWPAFRRESQPGTALEKHPGAAQNPPVSEPLTLKQLQQEAIALRRELDAVMLSTTSPEGMPDASYAPCVLDGEGRCHILISRLARHTKNLESHPRASLMWIENKAATRNVFARRRLILQCRAENIQRDSEGWKRILKQMEEQLGNTVQLLAGLPDFMLFCFEALEGNYVRGFGQAYPVSGNDLVMAERRTR